MMRSWTRLTLGRRRKGDERGYVAVMVALMTTCLLVMGAFAIDVGNWYLTGQQNQRAADAAALAGVTSMPGSFANASSTALDLAKANGYVPGSTVSVTPAQVPGQSARLQVTVSRTVDNFFGGLFGQPSTTISRSAIAAFTGPVPMGSPCNEFGNDPTPGSNQSANCSGTGAFWANVGSPKADKVSGDAYQNGACPSNGDGCSGSVNKEYDANGYFYTITVKNDMPSMQVEIFDPAFIYVGDVCDQNFGSGAAAAVDAKNDFVYQAVPKASRKYLTGESASTTTGRYAPGASSAYCNGDQLFNNGQPPDTTFTLRQPGASSYPWDPMSYAPVGGSCTHTYDGYAGDLYSKINQWNQQLSGSNYVVKYNASNQPTTSPTYDSTIAGEFRQWVPLCTLTNVKKGVYMLQVQTNSPTNDPNGNGHNRFALRAFGSTASQNADISVAGFTKMALYANLPGGVTRFFLAQVPPSAKGQILNVRLFDVGDSSANGTITVEPPSDSGLTKFTGCTGSGPGSVTTNCVLTTNSSAFQGKWETISIPLPTSYNCTLSSTGCWVKLKFDYGSGNQPSDTTSWQASIEGDPVRLVQ